MVHNTQIYWVLRLFPSSDILENRKHDVSETVSVSFLRWGGKTPTQLGPLESLEVSSFEATQLSRCLPPSSEDGNRSSFRNVVFSILQNTGRWKKSKNPIILCANFEAPDNVIFSGLLFNSNIIIKWLLSNSHCTN
jgi:hypothetical protein